MDGDATADPPPGDAVEAVGTTVGTTVEAPVPGPPAAGPPGVTVLRGATVSRDGAGSRATEPSTGEISHREAGVAYAETENEPASDCQIPPPPRRPARSSRYRSVAERTASPTSRGKARPTSGAGSASASPISCSGTGRPSFAPMAAAIRCGAAPCGTIPLDTHRATDVLS